MSDCIFCNIISEQIPSFKIREDEHFLAILDVFPNTKGQTLIIPKKHYDSDVFEMDEATMTKFFIAAKKVSKLLKKSLQVKRVALVMEGMWVNHAHIKLYPLHGLESKREEIQAKETTYFDHYKGYLSTQLGPKADMEQLQVLTEEIRNS